MLISLIVNRVCAHVCRTSPEMLKAALARARRTDLFDELEGQTVSQVLDCLTAPELELVYQHVMETMSANERGEPDQMPPPKRSKKDPRMPKPVVEQVVEEAGEDEAAFGQEIPPMPILPVDVDFERLRRSMCSIIQERNPMTVWETRKDPAGTGIVAVCRVGDRYFTGARLCPTEDDAKEDLAADIVRELYQSLL